MGTSTYLISQMAELLFRKCFFTFDDIGQLRFVFRQAG